MKGRTFWVTVWSLVGLLLSLFGAGNAERAYHGGYTTAVEASGYAAIIGLAVVSCGILFKVDRCAGQWTRGAIACMTVYLFLESLSAAFPGKTPKIAFYTLLAVISAVVCRKLRRVSDPAWRRLHAAIAVAASIFALSPIAFGFAVRNLGNQDTTFQLSHLGVAALPKNVFVLLLDETSPEYIANLTDPLKERAPWVVSATIPAAGKNTINAIPSLLVGGAFDDVVPCGSSTLCGPHSLDFKRLTAAQSNTDVIGFYHPYCQIKNLRYCYQARPEVNLQDHGFLQYFLSRALYQLCIGEAAELGCGEYLDIESARRMRWQMYGAIDRAPFWREGGVMYAHIPLPHLPAERRYDSKRSAYLSNINTAGKLVAHYTELLKERFGSDYLLVLISDHPYRNSAACTASDTAVDACEGLPPNSGMVPIIMASGRTLNVKMPKEAAGLLRASE